MTRINIGVPPEVLDDWRLIAEINEMPRVCEVYKNRIEKNMNFGDIPKHFTLGEGHVKFFLNKGRYIHDRYNILCNEFNIRRLNIKKDQIIIDITPFFIFKSEHFKDYEVKELDKRIIVRRIIESIKNSDKLPMYKGFYEPKEIAIERLLKVAKPIEKVEQEKLF